MQKVYVILVMLMFVCIGCQWQLKPSETDASGRRIGIQRFDRMEMLYLTTGDYAALQQMNTYFPTETRMLIEDMLHLGQVDDPEINTKFLFFFQDSTLQQMLNDVQQQYANMDDVDEQLSMTFRQLKEELPDVTIPTVYTQIGSFDQSIIVSGTSLGVSLDKYLGADYPFYREHYSEQERRLMHRDMIVPDCLCFYLLSIYPMPKGSEQALKNLYDNYKNPMFQFALSIVKNYDLAEEAVQDTFVNIISYSKNSSIDNSKSWLFAVVKHQCLKILRQEHTDQKSPIEDFSETLSTADSTEIVGNSVDDIEALQCLDDLERQIVTLCIYGQLTQKQTAQTLNIPYMKVRSKYNYAVKKLRKFYIERGRFS